MFSCLFDAVFNVIEKNKEENRILSGPYLAEDCVKTGIYSNSCFYPVRKKKEQILNNRFFATCLKRNHIFAFLITCRTQWALNGIIFLQFLSNQEDVEKCQKFCCSTEDLHLMLIWKILKKKWIIWRNAHLIHDYFRWPKREKQWRTTQNETSSNSERVPSLFIFCMPKR